MGRPKLFFQEGDYKNDWNDSRIRIIYPDGTSEWMVNDCEALCPCWSSKRKRLGYGKFRGQDISQTVAIQRMEAYDKKRRFPKAIYLGEL